MSVGSRAKCNSSPSISINDPHLIRHSGGQREDPKECNFHKQWMRTCEIGHFSFQEWRRETWNTCRAHFAWLWLSLCLSGLRVDVTY